MIHATPPPAIVKKDSRAVILIAPTWRVSLPKGYPEVGVSYKCHLAMVSAWLDEKWDAEANRAEINEDVIRQNPQCSSEKAIQDYWEANKEPPG